jgi:hypothetical protein
MRRSRSRSPTKEERKRSRSRSTERRSIDERDGSFDIANYEYDIGLKGFENNWSAFDNTIWFGMKNEPITKEEVAQALEEKRLRAEPVPIGNPVRPTPRHQHVERIAWLVSQKQPWEGTVVVDVDAAMRGQWGILYGNHRVAAAIYRGDATIKCRVHGHLEDAEVLFGIKPRDGPSWVSHSWC